MARWAATLTAIAIATALTLGWLAAVTYFLFDLGEVFQPGVLAMETVGLALLVVVVPPVAVWLLAAGALRGRRMERALARIEESLEGGAETAAGAFRPNLLALQDATEDAVERLQEVATLANQRRGELVQVAEPMAELAVHLHSVLHEMRVFGDQVSRSEQGLVTLVGQVGTFKEAAAPLIQLESRLNQQRQALKAVLRQLTENGEQAVARLQEQARLLSERSRGLAGTGAAGQPPLRQIEGTTEDRIGFLADARSLARQLNAKAIDLHGLLKVAVPAEVLAAAREGDVAAVARRLPRLKTPEGVRALTLHYRNDATFREVSDRYLEAFEALLADSRAADPGGDLAALFLTSDLGRLYLVLTRETGRPSLEHAPPTSGS